MQHADRGVTIMSIGDSEQMASGNFTAVISDNCGYCVLDAAR